MPIPLVRALVGRSLVCTRCGSPDIHPVPGAFGPLIGLMGLMRYGCRGCRKPFWIRVGAGRPSTRARRPPGDSMDVSQESRPKAAPADLDFEVTPVKREKVDLSALDVEFEKIRKGEDAPQPPKRKKKP